MTDKPYATGGIVPGGKPVIVGVGTLGHVSALSIGDTARIVIDLGRCKVCKHWGAVVGIDSRGECWVQERSPNGMYADSHDGDASVMTGPDFGCVRWERKE